MKEYNVSFAKKNRKLFYRESKMKFKKWATFALAVTTIAGLSACNGKKSSSNDIVTEIKDETTVTFWHAMNGEQEKALTKIKNDFQKENPKIKIKLQNQQEYKDLQAKLNSTIQTPKNLPTITQGHPGWFYDAAKNGQMEDLTPYIENDKIGWGDQEKIRQPLLDGAKIEDVQYGIPFNKSTEALFYNEDMFKEYGAEVPKTLDELKEVSKTIYQKSNGQVVGAGFDALDIYYFLGMENKGIEVNKDVPFDSKESREVVNYYADGVKNGYFQTAGSDKYVSVPFGNKKVAMFIGSISAEPFVAKNAAAAGYKYGMAVRPEKKNIQRGTDIYMFKNASGSEKTAAFEYMKYLSSPKVQLYWAQKSGYMPVVESVLENKEYLDSKDTQIPGILAESTKDLVYFPVTENSNAVLNNEVKSIMENILSNPKGDREKMIQDGTKQLQAAWNQ